MIAIGLGVAAMGLAMMAPTWSPGATALRGVASALIAPVQQPRNGLQAAATAPVAVLRHPLAALARRGAAGVPITGPSGRFLLFAKGRRDRRSPTSPFSLRL